jgi:hypothetical protein
MSAVENEALAGAATGAAAAAGLSHCFCRSLPFFVRFLRLLLLHVCTRSYISGIPDFFFLNHNKNLTVTSLTALASSFALGSWSFAGGGG